MNYSSTHYLKPGTENKSICGRGGRSADVTDEAGRVTCGLCERTKPYKEAFKVWVEKRRKEAKELLERNAKIAAAGFDPDKPLGEWTKEEVEAYVAWQDSQE